MGGCGRIRDKDSHGAGGGGVGQELGHEKAGTRDAGRYFSPVTVPQLLSLHPFLIFTIS